MKKNILILMLLVITVSTDHRAQEHNTMIPPEQTVETILQQAERYQRKQKYQQAIHCYKEAFKRAPCNIQMYANCAYCYTMLGQSGMAIATYKSILKKRPNTVSVLYNMAYALKMEGMADHAISFYQKAIELDPSKEEAYFGLGMAYLTKGDFKNGWRIHERYLKRTHRNAAKMRAYLKQGALAGKTILLRQEGGMGDTIQFLRYAKKLKELGARVIVSVQKELYPLIRNCNYIDLLLKTGDPLPTNYDDVTTLMSMPAVWYDYCEETVQEVQYIKPDPLRSAYWQEKIKHDTRFKIGICWGASIHNDSSRAPVAHRSIPLKELYPLHDIEGVSLYSLQRFDGEEQLHDVPPDININTFGPDFDKTAGAFIDTAAIIPHLDLVICVDSATAHLAGVLKAPVFLMLPYSTDWRWITGRTDTPWYPTMHIFKQPKPFDWQSVVQQIYYAIQERIAKQQ